MHDGTNSDQMVCGRASNHVSIALFTSGFVPILILELKVVTRARAVQAGDIAQAKRSTDTAWYA